MAPLQQGELVGREAESLEEGEAADQRNQDGLAQGMDGEDPKSLAGLGWIVDMSRDRVRNLERDG